MKKIIFIILLLVNISCFADTSDVIDTVINGDWIGEPLEINVYYASIAEPLNVFLYVPYEKNPVTLTKTNNRYHVPPKKGYFIIVKDIKTINKYTHFSTCNNYFAPVNNFGFSNIEVGFPDDDKIGYCGVYPSPNA